MKLSVSLSDDDLAVLDAYVTSSGLPSRSAGVQKAIRMLRFPELERLRNAWAEWADAGHIADGGEAAADGLRDAAR